MVAVSLHPATQPPHGKMKYFPLNLSISLAALSKESHQLLVSTPREIRMQLSICVTQATVRSTNVGRVCNGVLNLDIQVENKSDLKSICLLCPTKANTLSSNKDLLL